MTTRSLYVFIAISFSLCRPAKSFQNSLFRAYDHTAENIFTSNIEGPAIDKDWNLYVVNYQKDGTIGIVSDSGSVALFAELPEKSTGNSIQFNKRGQMFIADFTGHNILTMDMATKAVTVFCHNNDFNQPNDICINNNDQIFASDPDWKAQTGKLWRIDPNGIAVLLKDKMGTTNGICLSPNQRTLYVNESAQLKVWAFDVDEKGDVSRQRLFTSFTDFGLDGMKCDHKGNLYITRYGKGAVAVFNSEGKQIQEVMLKGKNVSNLTFGGYDYRTCFVTLQDRKAVEKFRSDVAGK